MCVCVCVCVCSDTQLIQYASMLAKPLLFSLNIL